MKTRIVGIGNSHGIRIPKLLLEQTGLAGEVEIRTNGKTLVIGSVRKHRAGWAEAFQLMARRSDDVLADAAPNLSTWDEGEWEWQ